VPVSHDVIKIQHVAHTVNLYVTVTLIAHYNRCTM